MVFDPSLAIEIISIAVGMGAVYGAIRSDLIRLHEKIGDARAEINDARSSAVRAHQRLDDHISDHHITRTH